MELMRIKTGDSERRSLRTFGKTIVILHSHRFQKDYCPYCFGQLKSISAEEMNLELQNPQTMKLWTCDCGKKFFCPVSRIEVRVFDLNGASYTVHASNEDLDKLEEAGYEIAALNNSWSYCGDTVVSSHEYDDGKKAVSVFQASTELIPTKSRVIKKVRKSFLKTVIGGQSYARRYGGDCRNVSWNRSTFSVGDTMCFPASAVECYAEEILRLSGIELPDNCSAEERSRLCSKAILSNAKPNIALLYDESTGVREIVSDQFSGFYDSILRCVPVSDTFKKMIPHELIDTGKFVDMMCGKLGIKPGKAMRKIFFDFPANIGTVKWFMEAGVKKYDNLLALLNLTRTTTILSGSVNHHIAAKRYIKRVVKAKGENVLVKRLNTTLTDDTFYDTMSMLSRLDRWQKKNSRVIVTEDELCGMSIRELHERLSIEMRKLGRENREISYTRKEKLLNDSVGSYTISLAKDTNELIAVGAKLQICVGSYDLKALNKSSKILVMRNISDEPVACIEVDKKLNLLQVKGRRNTIISGEVGDAFKEYSERHSLITDKCRDFIKIGKHNGPVFVYGDHDFHNLELEP